MLHAAPLDKSHTVLVLVAARVLLPQVVDLQSHLRDEQRATRDAQRAARRHCGLYDCSMKTARVLLVVYSTVLSLGHTTADARADHSNEAGIDGPHARVLATFIAVTHRSIEEQHSADMDTDRQTRALQIGAGSANTDAANGPASVASAPPSSLSPSPSPPTANPSENPSSAPPPTIVPAPSPTDPTSPPPTLLPTLSPPTFEPTSRPEPSHEPSSEPSSEPSHEPSHEPSSEPSYEPRPTSSPLPDPTSSPVPPPPEPTSENLPPPPQSSTPLTPDDSTLASPTPSLTPEGNVIFDIRAVDTDERSTKKRYTRGNKDAALTSQPRIPSTNTDATMSDSSTNNNSDIRSSNNESTARATGTDAVANTQEHDNTVTGGRMRDNPMNAVTMSTDDAAFHDVVRNAACTVAGISVALLLFFHYAALDPRVAAVRRGSQPHLWTPNTWEFVLYVTYLQQMSTLSQLSLARAPYVLWDFTDAFAWSLFVVQRPSSSNDALTSTGQQQQRRRLDTVELTGVVAFADRVGIHEASLLFVSSFAFLLAVGALAVVFVVTVLLAKRTADDTGAGESFAVAPVATPSRVFGLRFVSLRFLGLCLLLWHVALYPLSLFASFELAMQLDAGVLEPGALVLAVTVLSVVALGVLAQCARALHRKTERELADVKTAAVYGVLYAAFTYRRRLFFVVGASVQVVSGVLIGALTALDAATLLVVTLLVLQVAYVVAVVFAAGFVSLSIGLFTFALAVVKIVNFALAFAFLDATDASSALRMCVATAFIVVNTVVLVAWFVRHAVMLVLTLQALAQRPHDESAADPYSSRQYRRPPPYLQLSRAYVHDDNNKDDDIDIDDDDDALVPEMVEFQTPVKHTGSSSNGVRTGNSSTVVMFEPKGSKSSSGSEGPRGSNVYVTLLVSPARDRDRELSRHSDVDSSNIVSLPTESRSTIKIAL